MIHNKKAFWIIYVFFLISFILSFWLVILNKQSYFEKKIELIHIEDILLKNIMTDANISLKNHKDNNVNVDLYIPILSCPQDVKIFSWAELIDESSLIFQNQTCSGVLNGENLEIYFNTEYNHFSTGVLWWTEFSLDGESVLSWSFSHYEISFNKPTIFDDRFVSSRLEKTGVIFPGNGFQNIFWNNSKIHDFIEKNSHNIPPFEKLWQTSSWVLYFDVNDSFSGKIVRFDRQLFDTQNKILKSEEISFSHQWWVVWYLQDDLTFSWVLGNPKILDFHNNDYAIFLSYQTGALNNIRYHLRIFTPSWTGVYINPIQDYGEKIEFLWNTISFIGNNWYNKIQKIISY